MQQFKQPIGLLGGTFDPIHTGHLRLGLEAYQAVMLAKVYFIPCYQPVHRQQPLATPEARLAMLQLAIANETAFSIDTHEFNQKKPRYSIETLEELHAEMPDTPLCLIIGLDAFLEFATWHRYQDILQVAHLIVAHRPAFQIPTEGNTANLIKEYRQNDPHYLHQHLAGGLFLLPITQLDISASEIRKQIAMRKNPRYLLPDAVYNYLQQHGTYNK